MPVVLCVWTLVLGALCFSVLLRDIQLKAAPSTKYKVQSTTHNLLGTLLILWCLNQLSP